MTDTDDQSSDDDDDARVDRETLVGMREEMVAAHESVVSTIDLCAQLAGTSDEAAIRVASVKLRSRIARLVAVLGMLEEFVSPPNNPAVAVYTGSRDDEGSE